MNKNNQRNLIKNYFYNTIYNILAILLPMVSIPYVTRRISADTLGAYNYTQSIVYFFVLIGTLGMGMFSQREIAFCREDVVERNKVFWELVLIRFCSVGIILITYIVFTIISGTYIVLYCLQVLDILAAMVDITWFFQGQEDFKKPVVRNIFIKCLILIFTFLFVKSENDLYIYIIIHSFLQFAGNISLWGFCKGKIRRCSLNELHPMKYMKGIVILFVPQLVVQIYSTIAKPLLGILTDTAQVAYYEQALKIIKIVTTLITAIGTVMLPRMSTEFHNDNKKEIQIYMQNSYQIVMLLGYPLLVGVIVIAEKMVGWFYGEDYAAVGRLIMLLAPIIIISGMSSLTSMQYLIPSKRQREYTVSIVCGSIANIVLNVLLIPYYGAGGAAIATVFSEVLILVCQIFLVKCDLNIAATIWNSKKYLLCSLVMGGVTYVITRNMASSIWTTSVQGIIGLFIYLGLLVGTKDPYVSRAIVAIRHRI